MQASGVHGISSIMGRFTASAALHSVFRRQPRDCRSPRVADRYVLRSGQGIFIAESQLMDTKKQFKIAKERQGQKNARVRSQYCSLRRCRVAYLAWLEDVCPGWVTLLLGLFKMFVLAWSRCVLGFPRCLPWLGRVASWAFQDVCPGLVALRLGLSKMFVLAWSRCGDGGICAAKILRKHAGTLGSDLEVVPAPFSRFFIANTLHHRLRAGSLLPPARCVMGSNLVAFASHWLCDGLELGSALESGSALAGAHFRLPLPHCGRGLG